MNTARRNANAYSFHFLCKVETKLLKTHVLNIHMNKYLLHSYSFKYEYIND